MIKYGIIIIGEDMKKIFSNLNKPLLIITIIFLVFGLLMIQSASSMESYMRYGKSPYYYFNKQTIFIIGGLFATIFILIFPTKNYRKMDKLFIIGSIASLVLVYMYGTSANNAKSWFNLGFFSLQPSELVKIALILYLACYYEKHKDNLNELSTLLIPIVLIIVVFVLIAVQPDLGTGSIVILMTGLIFYAVPIPKEKKRLINKIVLSGIALVLVLILVMGKDILRDYQLQRFNFLEPCERYQEKSGYQLCNSFIAFSNGGLNGQGIGASTQKYLYLPESYTDFIFPIIVEEWGLLIGIVIIISYAVLLYLIYKIALRATNLRNSLIAYGAMIYIFLHIAINLIGVMGIGPLTGVPLPFLSSGGSYTLSLIVVIALVQRVNIETNIANQKKV